MIPHLTTALTGPLLDLESRMLANSTEIEHWFRAASLMWGRYYSEGKLEVGTFEKGTGSVVVSASQWMKPWWSYSGWAGW